MARSILVLRRLSLAVLLLGVAPHLAYGSRWSVNTGATYQSGNDSDQQQRGTPLAATQSLVDLSPDDFSYAEATGESDAFQWPQSPDVQGADLSSFSRAAGYDPAYGPPQELLSAHSETGSRILWWSNHDANLQPGDDIVVEVTVATSGQMAASQFFGPSFQAQAWAGINLDLYGGQGGTIDYEGTMAVHADPMDGTAPPLLTGEQAWDGAGHLGTPLNTGLGTLAKYELEEVERFTFDSFIGEPFVLDFLLSTVASADGPFETYTLADFDANYRLRALDPVTGAPVPAPFLPITEDAVDFDADGQVGCADIDGLTAAIAAGTHDPLFDLSGDGSVDADDLDQWLLFAGALTTPSGGSLLRGDANLDGVVDGADYIAWNNNKFTFTSAWCDGDFDANGRVDGADFVLWNANKFQAAAQVPEPAVLWLLPLCLVGLCRRV